MLERVVDLFSNLSAPLLGLRVLERFPNINREIPLQFENVPQRELSDYNGA